MSASSFRRAVDAAEENEDVNDDGLVFLVEDGAALIQAEDGIIGEDSQIELIEGDGGRDNGDGDHLLLGVDLDDGDNLSEPLENGVAFDVFVGEDETGVFSLETAIARFGGNGESDKGNDFFLKVTGPNGEAVENLIVNDGGNDPNPVDDAIKIFSNNDNEDIDNEFVFTDSVDGEDPNDDGEGNFDLNLDLAEAGTYTFEFLSRSDDVGFDSFAVTRLGEDRADEDAEQVAIEDLDAVA